MYIAVSFNRTHLRKQAFVEARLRPWALTRLRKSRRLRLAIIFHGTLPTLLEFFPPSRQQKQRRAEKSRVKKKRRTGLLRIFNQPLTSGWLTDYWLSRLLLAYIRAISYIVDNRAEGFTFHVRKSVVRLKVSFSRKTIWKFQVEINVKCRIQFLLLSRDSSYLFLVYRIYAKSFYILLFIFFEIVRNWKMFDRQSIVNVTLKIRTKFHRYFIGRLDSEIPCTPFLKTWFREKRVWSFRTSFFICILYLFFFFFFFTYVSRLTTKLNPSPLNIRFAKSNIRITR